jgi:crooked neck
LGEVERARALLQKAFELFKGSEQHEERFMVFEQWRDLEAEVGDEAAIAEVRRNVPRKVKKRRRVHTEDGFDAGYEEVCFIVCNLVFFFSFF